MINMLKGCPRCCGDLYANDDTYGKYYGCLQCGHYLSDCEANDLYRGTVASGNDDSPTVPKWALLEIAA